VRDVEKAITLMVASSQADPPHSGVFGQLRPGFGVKAVGSEILLPALRRGELFVFLGWDGFIIHHPFVSSGAGVQAPVDEQAKTLVQKPIHPFIGKLGYTEAGGGNARFELFDGVRALGISALRGRT